MPVSDQMAETLRLREGIARATEAHRAGRKPPEFVRQYSDVEKYFREAGVKGLRPIPGTDRPSEEADPEAFFKMTRAEQLARGETLQREAAIREMEAAEAAEKEQETK